LWAESILLQLPLRETCSLDYVFNWFVFAVVKRMAGIAGYSGISMPC
jgi:hypothetical protein